MGSFELLLASNANIYLERTVYSCQVPKASWQYKCLQNVLQMNCEQQFSNYECWLDDILAPLTGQHGLFKHFQSLADNPAFTFKSSPNALWFQRVLAHSLKNVAS